MTARIRQLEQQHPELEILPLTHAERGELMELQEELAHAQQEAIVAFASRIAEARGISGKGYTLQVSEGVFTRPRKEQPAPRPAARKRTK